MKEGQKERNKKEKGFIKFLYDYLPLIVFFAVFKLSKNENPLIDATIYMVITTFFTLIIAYIFTKKIPKVALFSGIILGIFGSLTIFFENEIFIKIKPTIVNLLFAGVLIYGNLSKKPLISNLLEGQIRMSNAAWLILSRRWAIFFIFLAILNEVIWRGFPTEFWVKFKVFGIMPLSMIFTFFQIPFMMREMKKEKPANIQ